MVDRLSNCQEIWFDHLVDLDTDTGNTKVSQVPVNWVSNMASQKGTGLHAGVFCL